MKRGGRLTVAGLSLCLAALVSCHDEAVGVPAPQQGEPCSEAAATCVEFEFLARCLEGRWEVTGCPTCYLPRSGTLMVAGGCLRSVSGVDSCVCDSSMTPGTVPCTTSEPNYCGDDHTLVVCEEQLWKPKSCDELCGLQGAAGAAGTAGGAGEPGLSQPVTRCFYSLSRKSDYCDCVEPE
jgi:hypothetical protein